MEWQRRVRRKLEPAQVPAVPLKTITALPADLQCLICSFLPVLQVVVFRRWCRMWNKMICRQPHAFPDRYIIDRVARVSSSLENKIFQTLLDQKVAMQQIKTVAIAENIPTLHSLLNAPVCISRLTSVDIWAPIDAVNLLMSSSSKWLSNLKHLRIEQIFRQTKNPLDIIAAVQSLHERAPHLETLQMTVVDSWPEFDDAVLYSAARMPKLQTLKAGALQSIIPNLPSSIAAFSNNISKNSCSLRSLSLSSRNDQNGSIFPSLWPLLTQLTSLRIHRRDGHLRESYNCGLTSADLALFLKPAHPLPLSTLHLWGICDIPGQQLGTWLSSFVKLEVLDISHAAPFDDAVVLSMIVNHVPKLHTLKLDECGRTFADGGFPATIQGLTGNGLPHLSRLPNLAKLSLYGWPRDLVAPHLQHLALHCAKLKRVNALTRPKLSRQQVQCMFDRGVDVQLTFVSASL